MYLVKDKSRIAPLYEGWQETMIWSCLQDCMGYAYADDLENPKSANIIVNDFCFLAGEPSRDVVRYRPEEYQSDFIIMTPQNEAWAALIEEEHKEKAGRRNRYAIKKEPDVFNQEALRQIVAGLPQGYSLRMIDRELYQRILSMSWAEDLCSHFDNYEAYEKHGLGVVILKDGGIVSGASSYSWYHGGIEIEIDTRKDQRRRGLALVCGARLILECLARGLYPSWDAHNPGSVTLAEKLGYHFEKEYPVYEIHHY